jgi:hypothetical protein
MNRVAGFIWARATPRRAWLWFAIMSALLLGENLLPISPGAPYMRRVTGGMDFLDFGFSPASQAHALLVAFGPVGRHTQALLTATVDVAIPFSFGAFGVLSLTALGRALFGSPGRWIAVLVVPVLAAFFDYAENASIGLLLLTFPHDPAWLSILTHGLTFAKFLFYGITGVLVLVAACTALMRRPR